MGKTFIDHDGFLWKQRPQNKTLTIPLERELVEPAYFTDEELYASKGTVLCFDLEIFPNYFLAAFKQYHPSMFDSKTLNMIQNKDGIWKQAKVVTFELYPGKEVFNYQKLLWVLHNFCLVGFNSNKFDIPILYLALHGGTLEQLSEAVEKIIVYGAQPRDIEEYYKFKCGQINSVDLIEVAPLSASLKAYMARLHAKRLQELPYEPTKYLNEVEAHKVKLYCINDLDGTGLLCRELEPQLELRASMSAEYKVDLRSKSDAQIAEAVICSEVAKLNGRYPGRPKIQPGYAFNYNVPDFVRYETQTLQEMLELVKKTVFVVESNGKISNNSDLENYSVKIGNSIYRMGIGGLHSSEEKIAHYADETTLLIDRDVASYYPNIILNQELYPKHMGISFLEVYRGIVERRLEAKKAKNKVVADSLKICVNGSFGKLNSKYSSLYAPDLLIQVTLSGQLCLLMLIEMLELYSIPVVSGNTDGIVIKCPIELYDVLNSIVRRWEYITGFETEETRYKATFSMNVNNYIAVKTDNKVKFKGAYAEAGLSKNPVAGICVDAVINKITKGIELEETIKSCKDISKFVIVRNVKGGAYKDYDVRIPNHNNKEELVKMAGYYQFYGENNWKLKGSSDMGVSTLDAAYRHAKEILAQAGCSIYLGKLVRFYYAHKCTGNINYIMSGNKVPKSENGKPVLDLPNEFPDDVDYERYITEATEILYDIGYLQTSVQESFF